MPLDLDSCIAGVFTPGNIGASSGLPPVQPIVPSLDGPVPLVAEAAAASDTLDFFVGEVLHEIASASDSYTATGGAYEALITEAASAVDAALVHEPGDVFAAVTEAAAAADAPSVEVVGPPAILTGLIGWWDASVTASLTLSGADILSVADQSGLNNTMNWEYSKPTYSATGFNSTKPAIVLFNPSGTGLQALKATSFPMGTGNTLTAWVVTTMGGSGTQNYGRYLSYSAGSYDHNSVANWLLAQNGFNTTQCAFMRNSVLLTSPTMTASPAPHRLITTVSAAGLITLYVDGVSVGTNTSGGNWGSPGDMRIGNDTVGGSIMVAPIAEAGVATGYSDATAVAALDTYLKNKWGL